MARSGRECFLSFVSTVPGTGTSDNSHDAACVGVVESRFCNCLLPDVSGTTTSESCGDVSGVYRAPKHDIDVRILPNMIAQPLYWIFEPVFVILSHVILYRTILYDAIF